MKNIFLGQSGKRNRYILGGFLLTFGLVGVLAAVIVTKDNDEAPAPAPPPTERHVVQSNVTFVPRAKDTMYPPDLLPSRNTGHREDWGRRELQPKRPSTAQTTTNKPVEESTPTTTTSTTTKKPATSWITTPFAKNHPRR